jgi:hypothetical protein
VTNVNSRKLFYRIKIKRTKCIYFVYRIVNITLIGQNTQQDNATNKGLFILVTASCRQTSGSLALKDKFGRACQQASSFSNKGRGYSRFHRTVIVGFQWEKETKL